MNGGSYNYLYLGVYDLHDAAARRADIVRMLEALRREYPDSEATRDTEQLVAALDALGEAVRAVLARLTPVWRAVEWEHSGDTTAAETREAIEAYERRDGAK